MSSVNARLIEQIHANAESAKNPLERRLCDFAVWYYANVDTIPKDNVGKQLEFMHKCLEIQTELFALMLERLYDDKKKSRFGLVIPELAYVG